MKYPCYIPLIADAADPRKFVAPKNNGVFLIFTDMKLFDKYLVTHHPGHPQVAFDIANAAQLLDRLTKLQKGLFHSVQIDLGREPIAPEAVPMSQFLEILRG